MEKQWDEMTELERCAHMCERVVDIHGGNAEALYHRLSELGARHANGAAFRFAFKAFLKTDETVNNSLSHPMHNTGKTYRGGLEPLEAWYENRKYTDQRGAAYDLAVAGRNYADVRWPDMPASFNDLINTAFNCVDWDRVAKGWQEE